MFSIVNHYRNELTQVVLDFVEQTSIEKLQSIWERAVHNWMNQTVL